MLKKAAPAATIEKMVSSRLTVNRAALNMVARSGIIPKKKIETTALKVIKQYKKTIAADVKDGATKAEATAAVAEKNNALLVQRVQNFFVTEVASQIKDSYRGEKYIWLPSDAETPDPQHQLLYGQTRRIGRGEMPGERDGCRCGMEILVDENELDLEE